MTIEIGHRQTPSPREELQKLLHEVQKRDGNFTNRELMSFPLGTQVRLKQTVLAQENFKEVGALVFQPVEECDHKDGEHLFGILIPDYAVCFDFKASDYEIVSLDTLEVPPY